MKDDLTVVLIDSINRNDAIPPEQKLDLIAQTLRDCKQKKIGKIIMDAIESKGKKKRGRPKKELSENAKKMIKISQEADRADGRILQ